MVDVPTRLEFDALMARVAILEASLRVMPSDVKAKLVEVMAWIADNY